MYETIQTGLVVLLMAYSIYGGYTLYKLKNGVYADPFYFWLFTIIYLVINAAAVVILYVR